MELIQKNTPLLSPIQSAEKRWKECQRFCLRLRHRVRHTMILILNDRISASKKINRMVLIRTLTVSTILRSKKRRKNSTAFDKLFLTGIMDLLIVCKLTDSPENKIFKKKVLVLKFRHLVFLFAPGFLWHTSKCSNIITEEKIHTNLINLIFKFPERM